MLFRPTLPDSGPCDFPPAFGRQFLGSRFPALGSAQLTERDCRRIPAVLNAILNLPRRDVANELGERNRVTRALLETVGHAAIIAQTRTTDSRAPDFKLTHYQLGGGAYLRVADMQIFGVWSLNFEERNNRCARRR